MRIIGVDFAEQSDNFAMIETEILGSFKAPHAHDVIFKIKDWQIFPFSFVKENTPWNEKHE